MSGLTEDHDLLLAICFLIFIPRIILFLDAALQLEHHRTSSINNLNIVLAGQRIRLWRFTMRTQQHLRIMQLLEVVMINGNQTHLSQSFTLHPVMNDIAQTVQRTTFRQFLFRLAYGRGHTETET